MFALFTAYDGKASLCMQHHWTVQGTQLPALGPVKRHSTMNQSTCLVCTSLLHF